MSMFVRHIVEAKKIKQIITIKPSDTVTSAAQVLARHGIGALIVSRDGAAVDGILSERDIVKSLGTMGVGCMTLLVQDLMTQNVIACEVDETANSVLERMTRGRFRHMPVTDEAKLVGVISIGDVVKARIDEIEHENTALTEMISNSW
jgi:CBS domain-containing protein